MQVIEVLRPEQFQRPRRAVQFSALGQQFSLDLQPNTKLLAPQVETALTALQLFLLLLIADYE